MSPLPGRLSSTLDTVLDRSVVLGYSRIGYAVRSRLWSDEETLPSLHGKRILVTGATSGIGMATAEGLARLGATVHVLGHDPEHLDRALAELRADVPDGDFVPETCDLSSLAAVRSFCADFLDRVTELHGIAHNAGSMAPERRETDEGHEFTLAVHVLGPMLMTCLLRSALAADGDARVVFMSSGGMYTAKLRADDIEYHESGYSGAKAYARTKRYQVTLAELLADRLGPDGIRVDSMHPGWVETPGVRRYLPKFRAATRPVMRPAAQGADTMVWLLAADRPTDSGDFWHDRSRRPTYYLPRQGESAEERSRLWAQVTDAVGCEP